MPDYKEMYMELFRAITAAEDKIAEAALILHKAQLDCETLYIEKEAE